MTPAPAWLRKGISKEKLCQRCESAFDTNQIRALIFPNLISPCLRVSFCLNLSIFQNENTVLLHFFARLLGEKETIVLIAMPIGSKMCETIVLTGPMASQKNSGCFQPAFQIDLELSNAQAGENLAPWNPTREE